MRVEEMALAAGAIGFAGSGAALLAAPELVGAAGLEPRSSTGRVEVRAFYGGFELGIAAFLALAAFRPTWRRPALTAQTLTLGGTALARVGAMALEGRAERRLLAFLALEAGAAAVSALALAQLGRSGAEV